MVYPLDFFNDSMLLRSSTEFCIVRLASQVKFKWYQTACQLRVHELMAGN